MSEFFKRKVNRLFNLFDKNGDGLLDMEELNVWAKEFIGRESSDKISIIWSCLFKESADKDRLFETLLEKSDNKREIECAIEALFELIDSNGNGDITRDEYEKYLTSLGVKDNEISTGFNAISSDFNVITKQEFCDCGVLYLTSQDQNCYSRHFFGEFKL